METLAVAAAVLCGLVSVSTFRFQRFTLSIARGMVFPEGSGEPSRGVRTIQNCISPAWMRQLEYLGYLLGIIAIVFGSQEFGWTWGIAIIAWLLFGRGLVSPLWPLPSTAQCLAIAKKEATRGLAEAMSRDVREAQQMYVAVIAKLETVRTSSKGASPASTDQ
jgi:hypothetical protein